MNKPISEFEMFERIQDGGMDFDDFMCWVSQLKTNSHSQGYKEGCEQSFRMASGYEF